MTLIYGVDLDTSLVPGVQVHDGNILYDNPGSPVDEHVSGPVAPNAPVVITNVGAPGRLILYPTGGNPEDVNFVGCV